MEERELSTQGQTLEQALDGAWEQEDTEEREGITGPDPLEEPEEAGQERAAPDGETDQSTAFTLKHLNQVRTVGKEEVIRLAQQGLDYERVRAERDRLRDYRSQAEALSGRGAEQPGGQTAPERARQERLRADMDNFIFRYPQVKPEEIPGQVWAAVRRGESLTEAYTRHHSSRLEAELAAERQNRENQRRSTGSLASGDDGLHQSELDKWWNYE